jgi:hypothetical protein
MLSVALSIKVLLNLSNAIRLQSLMALSNYF